MHVRRHRGALSYVRAAVQAAVLLMVAIPALADVEQLDAAALDSLPDEVLLVDIRRPDEWRETGVVPGALPLTFFDRDGTYDAVAWLAALDERLESSDSPVVLICRSGVRSARVAQWLDERGGFSAVGHVTRGIEDWRKQGGKTQPWP